MASTLNKHRLNNLLKGVQTSINSFDSQGYPNVYFSAQFFCKGKKQNGIERGDIHSFGKQVRTYITSEEADAARVEFFNETTGKSIYSKALTDLRNVEDKALGIESPNAATSKTNSNEGLGEARVNEMVDKKFEEMRKADEMQRLTKEVDELRCKNAELTNKEADLEAKLRAKGDLEFYSGLIGTAFPGLTAMLKGTPLEGAASFLSGTAPVNDNALTVNESKIERESNISSMVNEFCGTLSEQEAGAIHLMFTAFEADKSKIQRALQFISTEM